MRYEDLIWIPGNVPSSKNGKVWTGKFFVVNKTVASYYRDSRKYYALPDDLESILYLSWQTTGSSQEWLPINRWRADPMANASVSLSKLATNKPTATINAPIPVDINAALNV